MRVSKTPCYENPYVKYDTYGYRTGLQKAPKVIWKARRNGTWKAKNVETWDLIPKRLIGK